MSRQINAIYGAQRKVWWPFRSEKTEFISTWLRTMVSLKAPYFFITPAAESKWHGLSPWRLKDERNVRLCRGIRQGLSSICFFLSRAQGDILSCLSKGANLIKPRTDEWKKELSCSSKDTFFFSLVRRGFLLEKIRVGWVWRRKGYWHFLVQRQ